MCKIVGDLSGLRNSMRVMSNSDGKKYYRVDFVVEVFFGQTALSADLAWNENVRWWCLGLSSREH